MIDRLRRPAVGIDVGSHSVKVVALERHGEGFSATAGEAFYGDGFSGARDVYDFDSIRGPLSFLGKDFGLKGSAAAVSLSGASVFTSVLDISESSQVHEAVSMHLRRFFPDGMEDCRSDFCVDDSGGRALIVVAKTDAVEGCVSAVRDCGIVPGIVDYDGFALINTYMRSCAGKGLGGGTVLINVGRSVISFAVLDNSRVVLTRDLLFGSGEVTLAIARSADMTPDEAEMCKVSLGEGSRPEFLRISREFALKVAREVKLSLEMLASSGSSPSRVVVSGGGSLLHGFSGVLEETLGVGVEFMDPLRDLCDDGRWDGKGDISVKSAVALGLALRVAEQ